MTSIGRGYRGMLPDREILGARVDELEAVYGTSVQLLTQPNAAGNLVPQPTSLIRADKIQARQWVITLMQPTKGTGVSPWATNFDATASSPGPGGGAGVIFGAPQMPLSGFADTCLQVSLRWGRGGARFETRFDYPAVGATFGVTADTLSLDVAMKTPPTTAYATQDAVPRVGAFMVAGIAAEPSPLRWLERFFSVPGTGAPPNVVNYSIKPYARHMRLSVLAPASTPGPFTFSWFDTDGTEVWRDVWKYDATDKSPIFDVPVQATWLQIVNGNAGSAAVAVEWQIGLV